MLLTIAKLVRAPAGFTAISNILAASVLASQGNLNLSILWLIAASCCFYYGGMMLNDCFDFQEDKKERPSRPLPSGELSLKMAWGIGLGLLACGLIFSFVYSHVSALIGVALSVAIVLYNGLIKEGFGGSLTMASCRYLNWLLGASFVVLSTESYLLALPILFYITGLTFLSKQETHARDKSAVLVTSLFLGVTALSAIYLVEQVFHLSLVQHVIAYGLLAIWILLMLNKLRLVFFDFTPENIQKLIGFMVIGVIPLDALLVALSGHYLWALAILALLPPCRLLNKYLYVT